MTDARAAVIEIVDRRNGPVNGDGVGSILLPRELRINGVPVLVPAGYPIRIHELNTEERGPEMAMVTLTLYVGRVEIKAEAGDE
jgi:hypothetical protein